MGLGTGGGTGQPQVPGFPRGPVPLALGQKRHLGSHSFNELAKTESLHCAREYFRFQGTVNRGGQAPALGEVIADKWTVIKYANTHRGRIVGNATEGGWCRVRWRVRAGAVGSRVSGQGGGSQQQGDA